MNTTTTPTTRVRTRKTDASPGGNGSLADRFAALISTNALVLSALLAVAALSFGTEMLYLAPRGEQLRLALRAVRLGHVAMLNQETGVRGFILTHEQRFLDPYQTGRRDLLTHTDFLLQSMAAYPDVAGNLLDVRLAEQAWLTGAAEPSIAQGAANLDHHKDLFDRYRIAQARLEQRLEGQVNALVRSRTNLLMIGGALQAGLFALTITVSRRRLRRVQQEIGRPVEAVIQTMEAVRAGTLTPVARQPGPVELTSIQQGLDEMIAALISERAAREARTREANERSAVLRQILDSAREFSGSLNLRYVLRTLGQVTVTVAGAHRVLIWLLDDLGSQLRPTFDTQATDGIPTSIPALDIGSGLVGRAARYARTVTPDLRQPIGETSATPAPDELAVPLIVGARVVGVVQLFHGGVAGLVSGSREILEIIEILASHGAAAVESARLHQSVEERSHRDALTKLYNRRRLEDDLETEVNRARRYKSPLSFVMLDVDHFKRFNDTYGHARGDQILEEMGHVLESTVRNTDTPYRYGGEEFSVLLRETSAAGAAEFGERLRRRIEGHFQEGSGTVVTASVGVATFSPEMRGTSALVEAADAALYQSKREGRNRVTSAASQAAPSPHPNPELAEPSR